MRKLRKVGVLITCMLVLVWMGTGIGASNQVNVQGGSLEQGVSANETGHGDDGRTGLGGGDRDAHNVEINVTVRDDGDGEAGLGGGDHDAHNVEINVTVRDTDE